MNINFYSLKKISDMSQENLYVRILYGGLKGSHSWSPPAQVMTGMICDLKPQNLRANSPD